MAAAVATVRSRRKVLMISDPFPTTFLPSFLSFLFQIECKPFCIIKKSVTVNGGAGDNESDSKTKEILQFPYPLSVHRFSSFFFFAMADEGLRDLSDILRPHLTQQWQQLGDKFFR
jgi:hypothetical protein